MADRTVPLGVIAKEWARFGVIGFGGPPAHLALFRRRCVDERGWIELETFEHAVTAANLLPGPASTQVSIYCAYVLGGPVGAFVGGLCFIIPGLVGIIAAAALLFGSSTPSVVAGAAAGAGSVVAAIALRTGIDLLQPAITRARGVASEVARVVLYAAIGALACITLGTWLVLVLLGCGGFELLRRNLGTQRGPSSMVLGVVAMVGALPAMAWTALKVGALSFGGGFVIVPLMQADAVHRHHWMTSAQFLQAVALGQLTPGPVVQTVAAVGWAAGGLGGALLMAVVAFAPSFLFVISLAGRFDALRSNPKVLSFMAGAGPAAMGAILGSAYLLARAISQPWEFGLLGMGLAWSVLFRRSSLQMILGALCIGAVICGAGLGHP